MQRRKFLKYSAIAGTTSAIASCRDISGTSSGVSNSLQPIKIAILTWIGYGPFFIAKEQNLFAKHGLEAEILKIEDAAPRRSALVNQQVQFSITTLDWFAIEASQGLPATCILKLNDSYGADGIVASKDITSIADLQNQSIAVEQGSPSHFFLLSLLKQENISPEDVQTLFVPTAGDAAAAFTAGRTKAAVTWEPYLTTTTKQSPNAHTLVTSREQPGLLLDLLLVHSDYAKANPDAVSGVIKAWFDAVEFWRKNPAQANSIMAKGLGVSQQEISEMVQGCRYADYAENATYFGLQENASSLFAKGFAQAQEVWKEANLVTKTIPANSVTDVSFLKETTV
ncbi:ABC transporter substrate-binding protein [Gloeocapsa sp. BRSZ]